MRIFTKGVYSSAITRGGAPPAFSPTSIAGLQFWYSAQDVWAGAEPVDSESVHIWQDLSGNGLTLSQGTSTNQPRYETAIINSQPAIYFDGGDFMAASTSAISHGNTWVLIFQPTAGWDYLLDGNTTRQLIDNNGGPLRLWAGTGYNTGLTPLNSTTYFTFCFFNNASSYLRYNGIDDGTGNPGSNGFQDLQLGSRTGGTSNFFGYFAEVLLYDSILISSDVVALETYFNNTYNVF